MDPTTRFLTEYQRDESELLSADSMASPGLFNGEREFIEFAERDYQTDKHWAFEVKPEECALLVVDM